MPLPDVNLVDPALLSCWEEKVKQGVECSLLLEHSKGKVTTILKCTTAKEPNARAPIPVSTSQAEKKKKKNNNKGGKKKRLEALLSYHQRLVEEKGLPPSRLMLQHAAAVPAPPPPVFSCEHCDFSSTTQRGVKVHIGHIHKDLQQIETLRNEEEQIPLNSSQLSEERKEEEEVDSSSDEEEESPHKCPAFTPCLRPECKDTKEEEDDEEDSSSDEEEERPHKCPNMIPCTRQQCKLELEEMMLSESDMCENCGEDLISFPDHKERECR